MMVLEYGDEIIVIDAGVLFPSESMPGVDFAIPDTSYLAKNLAKVKAILITHGHEDHIGALPYVLPDLGVPVYASRLSHGLIRVKLKEHGQLRDARLNVIEPGVPFKIGNFGVEFFRVCHSIPDAMGLAIKTPLGTVIHTGDFKIDHTPADGKPMDFTSLAQIAAEGVLLLCSDSTYAEFEGYTPSEQVVGDALNRTIGDAKGRVLVATFASLISRMQQVIDAAVKHNRKVAVVGRSMVNNLKMATKMGYLNAPAGTVIALNEARRLPLDEVVILATGAQGEPTSALVRISNGEHKDLEIVPGDTVVISASPIPGNETLVSSTIDNLYRRGAEVIYSRIALVHVHGHGSREELKMMLRLVKPKFFVPIHGEYRHLVAHASIAKLTGIPGNHTFVLENGDVLELGSDTGSIVGKIPADHVFVDGQRIWGTYNGVLGERRRLAKDGVVVVAITLGKKSRKALKLPEVISYGFVDTEEAKNLLKMASEKAYATLDEQRRSGLEFGQIKVEIAASVSDFLYDETRLRPIVLVRIEEV